jgi:rare lipoprotein A
MLIAERSTKQGEGVSRENSLPFSSIGLPAGGLESYVPQAINRPLIGQKSAARLSPFLRLIFFAALIFSGCMGGYHRTTPFEDGKGLQGIASWYGPGFHGKPSASGEPYDMWQFTAAHRSLPFGTRVRVQSLENGKSVIVRINDRGPFIRGRIIDLSYAAARELAMIGKGTDEVILTVVSPETSEADARKPTRFWVQAGSFQSLTEAVSFQEQLRPHFSNLRLKTVNLPSGEWHRVQIGDFQTPAQARKVASELERQFAIEPFYIQDN